MAIRIVIPRLPSIFVSYCDTKLWGGQSGSAVTGPGIAQGMGTMRTRATVRWGCLTKDRDDPALGARQRTQGSTLEAVRQGAVRSLRDPEGRRGRRRDRRDRGGREAAAGRDRDLHDLRVLARGRRNVVGQHVPRGRGRRGLHLYSYSFKPYDWTRTHARQPELQAYLEETVDEFGLRPHCSWASPSSRPPGTTTATSGRSHSTPASSTTAMCSSARSASSTCPGIPTGPGWRTSRDRSSTPPAGSTSTT